MNKYTILNNRIHINFLKLKQRAMTDNLLSSIKQEDFSTIQSIKNYLQTIENKIFLHIDNYTLSSEKRMSKIEKTLSEFTIDLSDIQIKLNENKIKCMRIDEIIQANQKLKDQILSHDNKINKHTKDVSDSLNKFNQLLFDNLTIPGLVGSYCKFKTIKEYINYNNQQINTLIISKTKVMNEIEKFQKKIQDTLSKFSSQIDKLTHNHNHSSYYLGSFSELKNNFDESVKEANDKFCSMMIEKRNSTGQTQLKKNNLIDEDNHKYRNDNLVIEISNMKKDINLIKEHYCHIIERTNTKFHFKRNTCQSFEKIKTRSPLTPQYIHKKKKKKRSKGIQSFYQNFVSSTDLPHSRINKDCNEENESKTFLTENNNRTRSYSKINDSITLYSNDIHEIINHNSPSKNMTDTDNNTNENSYPNKSDNFHKSKFHEKFPENICNGRNIKKKETVFTTKEIPYNRAKRNRIQTQMFCQRDKISFLHFDPRKDKANICFHPKKVNNFAKVKSVDNLKARMNSFNTSKNQLSISNEHKENKNDKLQIDCSVSKNNKDDHENIMEECLEDRCN